MAVRDLSCLVLESMAVLVIESIFDVVAMPGIIPMVLYSVMGCATAVMMYLAALSVMCLALILSRMYLLLLIIMSSVWVSLLSPEIHIPRYLASVWSFRVGMCLLPMVMLF